MNKRTFYILLVQDNSEDQKLMGVYLNDPLIKTAYVHSMSSALKLLSKERFDLVLLDLDLEENPIWEGLETLTGLYPAIPLIVLASHEVQQNALEMIEKYASDYLIKTQLSRQLLTRSIRYAIERNEARNVILRDISERKLVEEVLKRDKDTLEKLVHDNAGQLVATQMELENAKRLSDIGTLAATVAHELRNPLAAISVSVANMKRKVKDHSLDKQFESIEKKVMESDQIINNLLFYSRVRPPQLERVYLYDLLNECLETIPEQAKKHVSLYKNVEAIRRVTIQADPLQIKEVFHNLINNAYDAVGVNGRVELNAWLEDKDIVVCIKDNGIGINKEDLARIFDPFFTTKAKGTGLGLTVCQKIIKMHEGSIGIESVPNEFTSVTVTLPVREQN